MDLTQWLGLIGVIITMFGALTTILIWLVNKIDNDVKSINDRLDKMGDRIDRMGNRIDGHAQRIDQLYSLILEIVRK